MQDPYNLENPAFCPAKWTELNLNLNFNYVYACCKAEPKQFTDDFESVIQIQKTNLSNGIKDPSCNYCWNVENQGGISRRIELLNKFDRIKFEKYITDNKTVDTLLISLGNVCNTQCIYCNPKFSTKWEQDVQLQEYKIFVDRHVYTVDNKEKNVKENNLKYLEEIKHRRLSLIGGEPLMYNNLTKIIDISTAEEFELSTNLNVSTEKIAKLINDLKKFKQATICVSVDSDDELFSFLRYGIEPKLFYKNLDFLLSNKDSNTQIQINTLMTNTSICDIENFYKKIKPYINNLVWSFAYCKTPRIHSFEALPDHLRANLIDKMLEISEHKNIIRVSTVISALKNIKFNNTVYKEFWNFIDQWESRKNIKLPTHIKNALTQQ